MDNSEVPDGWNSEEPVVGHLSCEEVARFGATFISTLRLIWSGKAPNDVLGMSKSIAQLLEHQNALFGSDVAKRHSDLFANKAELVGLIAICMAGVCSDAKIDPRSIASIAYTLMNGVIEMAKNTGPLGDDDIIVVDVRKAEGEPQFDGSTKIQLALRVEATKTIDDMIAASEDASTMMKMVREVNPVKIEEEKKAKHGKRRKKAE